MQGAVIGVWTAFASGELQKSEWWFFPPLLAAHCCALALASVQELGLHPWFLRKLTGWHGTYVRHNAMSVL